MFNVDTSAIREYIQALPKAELHVHLEGTLEPELKLKLSLKNAVDLGQDTVEDVRAKYQFHDLTSFLAVYYPAMHVLQTEDDFYELAHEYLQRAVADGVRRAEMFFDPQAHTCRGVEFDDVINGYYRAVREANDHGIDGQPISAALIMCFLRDDSVESAMETLEKLLPHKDKVIGVGLDSDERDNPPGKFSEVFARARAEGLRLTMHCDVDQIGSIQNIATVLREIRTERIDHGTNIVEDPELVQLAKELGIPFTCCPLSNSFVSNDMKAGEIRTLLEQGLLVTINSDDPAYFGGYVADNYLALVEKAGFTSEHLRQLAANSIRASWLPEEEKQSLLDEIAAVPAP